MTLLLTHQEYVIANRLRATAGGEAISRYFTPNRSKIDPTLSD